MPSETPYQALVTPAPLHALNADEVLRRLDSSESGLSDSEAARRLEEHGPNVIPRGKPVSVMELLWRQINSPLIWVLIGSATVAFLLGKVTDGAVVLAVVILNTIIGFFQEFRANRAIEALTEMVPESATAVRGGTKRQVPVAELVPGDVVLLASGDKVPADMRLFHVRSLQIDEAALTGESVPVSKRIEPVEEEAQLGDRVGMSFGGTLVTYGTGRGVVTATGKATELGRISAMLDEATEIQTPLTRALTSVGRVITIGILVLALVLLAVGTWRAYGYGVPLFDAFRESLIFGIALAVGAIPEGLPAIVTIALAIGVQRMAARQAIIRKLPAVETLGSTTVICSDKTGTLTRNEMTVQTLWLPGRGTVAVTGSGYAPEGELRQDDQPLTDVPEDVHQLLADVVLCTDAALSQQEERWTIVGDPTEGALLVAARKAGLEYEDLRSERPRIDAVPFESENQFMASLHPGGNGPTEVILKGAPEVVIHRCIDTGDGHAQALAEVERLAGEGTRVLAVATKDAPADLKDLTHEHCEDGFTLVGLVGMVDPPRPEAIEAVKVCHDAGIVVKMITGDHRATAEAIGKQLGLATKRQALAGNELARMDDEELRRAVREVHVVARVAPEHKLSLFRAIQSEGNVFAMTGDGVNDAPALRQSDIGVAMGITGTSVSKEAADVVLTDDNFATIAAAVEEGRRVYDNLVKSLAFVLPTNFGLALILLCAVLFFPFNEAAGTLLLPMLPTQLLWINLVATVALALPLAFEAKEPDTMRRPPRDPKAPILSGFVISRTVIAAVLMTAGAVGLFIYEYFHAVETNISKEVAIAEAQTMAVTTVIMFEIFYLLNCRSLRGSVLDIGFFSNKTIFAGAALLLLQAAFIYLPILQRIFGTTALDPFEIALTVIVGATILPVIALEKRIRRGWSRQAKE
ncbi:MAG: HAD-IC family P-type ATPase [Candidatus Hydrogenedentes bacterium]|nr:HAD-IC family P-type ATPase [Candidatus Hydrogenedentota bacterium]